MDVAQQAVLGVVARHNRRQRRLAGKWSPIAGITLLRPDDHARIDLFFSLDTPYEEIAERKRWFPFSNRQLPFLSVEDLVLFKLSFGRDKDWVDLRAVAEADADIDVDYVERQLIALRGPTMLPRLVRFRQLVRQAGGPTSTRSG